MILPTKLNKILKKDFFYKCLFLVICRYEMDILFFPLYMYYKIELTFVCFIFSWDIDVRPNTNAPTEEETNTIKDNSVSKVKVAF